MRSLDGPGSYAGSGVDVEIKEIYFDCDVSGDPEGDQCDFKGYVEMHANWVECPLCGTEVSF